MPFAVQVFQDKHYYCQTVFGCELSSVLLVTRYEKFIKKFACVSV